MKSPVSPLPAAPHAIARLRALGATSLAATLAATLAACGGGSGSSADAGPAPVASATTVLGVSPIDGALLANSAALPQASPAFHTAPVLLAPPSDVDAGDNAASASLPASTNAVPVSLAATSTQRLTMDTIVAQASAIAPMSAAVSNPAAGTTTTPKVVTTYTPAQIRAAYALPALPATGATPSATQAAQMGAGQTVYIVDAMHDPNSAAELAAFNQKFGLPACTTVTLAPTAALPLAAASKTACQYTVVYSTTSGGRTATAPAYDSGWATEIALDVQWVHATAPLARIVLIEAPDASSTSLSAAVRLANTMGPGVVSMSFGASEGSWTSSLDSTFQTAGMSYLAATGDSGAGVQWPAVSPYVLGVGGTTLTYTSGARSEAAWSGSGGGVSAYVAQPSYQTTAVPGLGSPGHRSVADVSFNADPYSGEYLAVMPQGGGSVSWMSAGGTSLATPQWAALLAIGNALRVQGALPLLGAPHAALYTKIASVPGTYAADLLDVKSGSDGSCGTCSAHAGYDTPTGLGTPNGTSILSTLAGYTLPPVPPSVSPATINGTVGTALTFTVTATAPNAVTYTLASAPSGMSISTAGVVTWSKPVAGTYAVTVTAKDTKTALTGSGVYTVVIAAQPAPPPPATGSGPTITAPAMTGVAGKALTGSIVITDSHPGTISVSITGVPLGMGFSVNGSTIVASWPSPVTGSYQLQVSATDAAGLTSSAKVAVTITAH